MQYDSFRQRRSLSRLSTLFVTGVAVAAVAARAQDAGAAGPPNTLPPPTAAIGGWSTWTPVAGPSFLPPSLALDPAGGSMEVASVGLDLSVIHSHVSGGAAPGSTGSQSFLSPVILKDAAGTAQLLVTGTDGAVTYSRTQNNAWSSPLPTGLLSFLPPAAALESDGTTIDLVAVGVDGGLLFSRFSGGAWSSPTPLNAVTLRPPTLAANPSGGVELAIVGLDRHVYHAHFSGTLWGALAPTGLLTDAAAAMSVTSDGVIHVAATDPDREIVHSRFVNNAWSSPLPIGAQSDLAPALVFNRGQNSLELLARGNDRTVQHARFVGGSWVQAVSLGMTTDVRPAIAADARGNVVAAVTATDGRVYVSHYASAAPPVASPPAGPSFSRDILRIFTNNGAKTCAQAGCHSGSRPTGQQNLEKDKAYASIVNVASSEQPKLKRVLPGNAANSYLFQKVSTGLMPRTGGPLTSGDIDLIRQWINAGAPNN